MGALTPFGGLRAGPDPGRRAGWSALLVACGCLSSSVAIQAQAMPVIRPAMTLAYADEMPVPADLQVPLILKVLTFDRNFEDRIPTELIVGIVFKPGDAASIAVRDDVSAAFLALDGKTVKKVPIRYIELPFSSPTELLQTARDSGVNVFYVTPGNSGTLSGLLEVSTSLGILTTTGVPDYVTQGVAVGIGTRSDKPLILINLSSSRSTGSEFDASLLRIARVIR